MADKSVLDTAKAQPKFVAAIEAVIDGLAGSDFVTQCGGQAISEMLEYKLDMALTLQEKLADHSATNGIATVNSYVSDLFFNTDQKVAEVRGPNGGFLEYDRDLLDESAQTVLSSLSSLGVTELPTVPALVEDFLARV